MLIDKLKSIPFFSSFKEENLSELGKMLIAERFSEGDILFKEGDPGTSMYILDSGVVEISKEGRVLTKLSKGSIFGEMSLFEAEARSASVTALEETSVFKINNSDFRKFLFSHPAAGMNFLMKIVTETSRRLRRTSEYFITVFETGKILSKDLTLTAMAEELLKRLMKDLKAEAGIFMIYNIYTEFFDTVCAFGENVVTEERAAELFRSAGGKKISVSDEELSLIGEPVIENDELLGYIILQKKPKETFSVEQQIAVSAVSNQAALGVRKAQSRQEEDSRRRLEEGRMRDF